MKYGTLRALEKHLDEAAPDHFASLYAILGKESFHRKTAYDRLLNLLLGKKKEAAFAVTALDGEGLDIRSLNDALYSSSLFSQKAYVAIHSSDKIPKPSMEWLEAYFAKPTSHITLILTAPGLHHGTNFYKKIEKYGVVLDIVEEKPWEKERSCLDWVQHFLNQAGKAIDAQTAQALVKQVGTDGTTLTNEMEKLICYVGEGNQIVQKDLSSICTGINTETIWQLGEAIFRLDASSALRISHALINEGTPLLTLLRQLRSQFQTDLQVCALLAKGGSPADVTALFGYMKGTILERHCHASRTYGLQRFIEGLLQLDAAEFRAKNSASEIELLEVLIVRLTR